MRVEIKMITIEFSKGTMNIILFIIMKKTFKQDVHRYIFSESSDALSLSKFSNENMHRCFSELLYIRESMSALQQVHVCIFYSKFRNTEPLENKYSLKIYRAQHKNGLNDWP